MNNNGLSVKLKEEEFIKSSVTVQEQQPACKKGVKMSLHEFLQSGTIILI